MMFFGSMFSFRDCPFIPVDNLEVSSKWYQNAFGAKVRPPREGDELGDLNDVAEVVLCTLADEEYLILVKLSAGKTATPYPLTPIIYASNLRKAHEQLSQRGISVSAIRDDGDGHSYFDFRDPDGHLIEVCEED